MSLDHLYEEGLAHREDIEIPFHIIFSFSTILIFLYWIHLNGHFYFFGLTTRIFLRTYQFSLVIYHMLFYWYFILHFNYCVDNQKKIRDSTKSRDCEEDLQILPVMATPITNDLVTVRPQIIFFQQNYFDELGSTPTYEANVIYPVLSFLDSSITVSTFHIFDTPLLHQDQCL